MTSDKRGVERIIEEYGMTLAQWDADPSLMQDVINHALDLEGALIACFERLHPMTKKRLLDEYEVLRAFTSTSVPAEQRPPHSEEMRSALRVIHTWAGVPGALDARHVRDLTAKALHMGANAALPGDEGVRDEAPR